jgi:hypothetical protein
MNILKIQTKPCYEITVDEVDVTQDYSPYFIRLGASWYNTHRDGYINSISGNLAKRLEEQFKQMHGVMHEQMDLYEDDNSRHPDNQQLVYADTSSGQMWLGTNKDPMRYGNRSR